ncbi:DUF58 domain-containing protein [Natronosporangium hydrolyticum]|uniref:DUF58 domain-containing protein n=1 Tax=Natronosporangium hydrolyticum TaxID=2811111 RepID=A0A895Y9T8_9ACTN|nr:DUF58 domain-containing protein [Natronosporangium hydrolyticum]QSB13075.1 DUF58 domain-containing protein [Natronosporangium hydrolyticum]
MSTPVAGAGWRPTRALYRATLVVALTLLTAALLGTRELVLLAVPVAVGTALALRRRPGQPPAAKLLLDEPTSVEGGPVVGRVRVDNDTPYPLLCVVHAQLPPWITPRHGVGYYAAALPAGTTTGLLLQGTARRWGRYRLGPAVARTVACDGLLVADGEPLPALPLAVYPAAESFDAEQAMPRAGGIVGQHRSRRPGEGGELADVRLFQPGDRLRRLNWRVTQRTGQPHVNTTFAERDAEVLLLLDVRLEAGVPGGLGGGDSVLDRTVRAAAAITEHFAHQGDRVALVEYGQRLRRLRAGTGRRQYLSALEWLVATDRTPTGFAPNTRLLSSGLKPPTALVIVLTPLLDLQSAQLLATLTRTGRSLVTVDTLPEQVRPPVEGAWTSVATRLWQVERANTIGRLRAAGVPVEPWQGAGSLDLMLRHVARLATTARVMAR